MMALSDFVLGILRRLPRSWVHFHEWGPWSPNGITRDCKTCDVAEVYDFVSDDVVRIRRKPSAVPDKVSLRVRGCAGCEEGHDHEDRVESSSSKPDMPQCYICKKPPTGAFIQYMRDVIYCSSCAKKVGLPTGEVVTSVDFRNIGGLSE